MSSRVERLERLDELRRIGALTDAEYEQEKARALNGFSGSSSEPTIEPPVSVESSAEYAGKLTGVRAHWASSPLGRNKSLALAAAVISTLAVGLLTHSLMVAGVWLAVCSTGAYWLYTGLRIEQKPEHEEGTAPWRVFFYVGCSAILFGLVAPWITGGRSDLNNTSAMASMETTSTSNAFISSERNNITSCVAAVAPMREFFQRLASQTQALQEDFERVRHNSPEDAAEYGRQTGDAIMSVGKTYASPIYQTTGVADHQCSPVMRRIEGRLDSMSSQAKSLNEFHSCYDMMSGVHRMKMMLGHKTAEIVSFPEVEGDYEKCRAWVLSTR